MRFKLNVVGFGIVSNQDNNKMKWKNRFSLCIFLLPIYGNIW